MRRGIEGVLACLICVVLAGCAKDDKHPPFVSGACLAAPCASPPSHGRGTVRDAAVDAGTGADAHD